jgi:hypothetical protein
MRIAVLARILTLGAALPLYPLLGQQADKPTTSVPRLVRLTGTFHPANGLPPGPTEGATLSIYREEQGGTPLWQETQNVSLDASGQYTAMLGITQNDGVPLDLFASGESRWVGIRFNRPGEAEQPRILLVSVPYALKAADAETLGGMPASAYLLAPADASATTDAAPGRGVRRAPLHLLGEVNTAVLPSTPEASAVKPRANNGQTNCIGVFANTTDLNCSVMWQVNGNVGIGTPTPTVALHVANPSSFKVAQFDGAFNTDSEMHFNTTGTAGNFSQFVFDDRGAPKWHLFKDPFNNFGLAQDAGTTFFEAFYNGNLAMMLGAGNVGVGTLPAYKLDVAGQVRSSSGGFVFPDGTTQTTAALGGGGGSGSQWANGSAGAIYYNGGNVGIGTATPGSKLDVAGDINFVGVVRWQGMPSLQFQQTLFQGFNVGVGPLTLASNATGGALTAVGSAALQGNIDGSDNTAVGVNSLTSSTHGSQNIAIGSNALWKNTTGNSNIALGFHAAYNLTGGGNSNNIHIGSVGALGDNNAIRIGGTAVNGDPVIQTSFFAAGIRGVTTGSNNAVPVMIDSNGQLGTVSSSRRFKQDIEDMGDASRGLMSLRPVTFRYKQPFADGSKPAQYGLIAEEVEEVYPDLVARSADGQIETVKYQVLDSMLLNEVQRQQREIDQLKQQNDQLQRRLERLEAAGAAGSR